MLPLLIEINLMKFLNPKLRMFEDIINGYNSLPGFKFTLKK
jgi:hypothetical protein